MLNQGALVLEGVTLGGVVQLVVKVLVDLAAGTVLDQETAENTLATHPEDLPVVCQVSPQPAQIMPPRLIFHALFGIDVPLIVPESVLSSVGTVSCWADILRHTGIGGTLPLSETTVATNSSGKVQLTRAGTRVHGDGLSDDEAIGNELADRLAGVGVGDLVDLVGIEPNLALTAAEDIGREALLGDQVDPVQQKIDMSAFHTVSLGTWPRNPRWVRRGVDGVVGRGRFVKASSIARCNGSRLPVHRPHLDQQAHAPISVVLAFSKSVGKWHSGTHILTALADDGRCR